MSTTFLFPEVAVVPKQTIESLITKVSFLYAASMQYDELMGSYTKNKQQQTNTTTDLKMYSMVIQQKKEEIRNILVELYLGMLYLEPDVNVTDIGIYNANDDYYAISGIVENMYKNISFLLYKYEKEIPEQNTEENAENILACIAEIMEKIGGESSFKSRCNMLISRKKK